jgi:hypothetical protein
MTPGVVQTGLGSYSSVSASFSVPHIVQTSRRLSTFLAASYREVLSCRWSHMAMQGQAAAAMSVAGYGPQAQMSSSSCCAPRCPTLGVDELVGEDRHLGERPSHVAVVEVAGEQQRVGGLADAVLLNRDQRRSVEPSKRSHHAAVRHGSDACHVVSMAGANPRSIACHWVLAALEIKCSSYGVRGRASWSRRRVLPLAITAGYGRSRSAVETLERATTVGNGSRSSRAKIVGHKIGSQALPLEPN